MNGDGVPDYKTGAIVHRPVPVLTGWLASLWRWFLSAPSGPPDRV